MPTPNCPAATQQVSAAPPTHPKFSMRVRRAMLIVGDEPSMSILGFVARPAQWLPALLLALSAAGAPATAQGESLPREHHAWGRFVPGAWQKSRITSETFDDRGQVIRVTVTDTRTTLLAADPQHYTLKVESSVEVLGKRIDAPPQIVKRSYDELPYDPTAATRVAEQVDVSVDNQPFHCSVLETVAHTAVRTVTSRTYYCRQVRPFTLRRDVTVMPTGGVTPQSQSSTYVVAMDMPHKVLGEIYSSSHIKSVYKQNGNTVVTVSVQVLDLPGGVVSNSSKELDANGQLIRRSTLELLEFDENPQVEVKVNAEPLLRMGLNELPLPPAFGYFAEPLEMPGPPLHFRGRGTTRLSTWRAARRSWGR